jgi:hypothetical protein
MKVRKFDRVRFLNYYKRAEEFYLAMSEEAEFERYNASALLGIHAAIALADSVTIYESGKRVAEEQHMDAVKFLKNICITKRVSKDGPHRLGQILSRKNPIAYGEHFKTIDTDELKSIRLNVERLFIWAYTNFKYLSKEINLRR